MKLHHVLSDHRIGSSLAITSFIPNVSFGVEPIVMPDGSNVRKTVADTAHRLQEKLLLCREDDTKSFFSLIVVSVQITCTVNATFSVLCYRMVSHVAAVGVPADWPVWLQEFLWFSLEEFSFGQESFGGQTGGTEATSASYPHKQDCAAAWVTTGAREYVSHTDSPPDLA